MVLWLAACAPIEVAARFEETRAACGLSPVALDADAYLHPPELDGDCRAAVLADWNADEASLASVGTLGTFLAAASALMTADLPAPGGPLGDVLAETAADTGGDDVAGLLYDYAAARFTSVVGAEDDDAHASVHTGSGRLVWSERTAAGIDAAALLVHEARHRDGYDHVECGGRPVCDDGDDGAWGLQLAVHELVLSATDDELVSDAELAWIEVVAASIR